MKTPLAQQPKPKRKRKAEPAPNTLSPRQILLEQAQICRQQASEAARLSRLQAARGLLLTAEELLRRAATLDAGQAAASAPAAITEAPLLDGCLSLRLRADESAGGDEFLRALESLTGTPWRWAGDILAVEKAAPHRVVALRGAALESWRAWRGQSVGRECELRVEVFAPLCGGAPASTSGRHGVAQRTRGPRAGHGCGASAN